MKDNGICRQKLCLNPSLVLYFENFESSNIHTKSVWNFQLVLSWLSMYWETTSQKVKSPLGTVICAKGPPHLNIYFKKNNKIPLPLRFIECLVREQASSDLPTPDYNFQEHWSWKSGTPENFQKQQCCSGCRVTLTEHVCQQLWIRLCYELKYTHLQKYNNKKSKKRFTRKKRNLYSQAI